ncbi:trypsin-like serine peptidase [Mycobacterium sp.]|uniref:trypsin-like serine peptidase n=1 Tax=Mycobacterium sp. TaxID=1785 RepID=UPI003BB0F75B
MRNLPALAALAITLVSCGHQARSAAVSSKPEQAASSAPNRVVAAPVDPDPRVGALFLSGSDLHACTGSVLHSATGDLVLTAAHCLSAGGPARFVPGFARAATPDDQWTVDALYLDPRWLANKDPLADYAIVRVSRPAGGSVEALVGSALSLGTEPARGSAITVVGYPAGVGGLPIGCEARTDVSDGGYPVLACAGLVDGTSGAPWISGSTVTGVIGGLHGGGCAENLSYSSPFDDHISQLFARAQAGGPGDAPPSSFDDEC